MQYAVTDYVCVYVLVQRIIRCGGPVEDDMANIIVAQLLYLDAIDPNKVKTEIPFNTLISMLSRGSLC